MAAVKKATQPGVNQDQVRTRIWVFIRFFVPLFGVVCLLLPLLRVKVANLNEMTILFNQYRFGIFLSTLYEPLLISLSIPIPFTCQHRNC